MTRDEFMSAAKDVIYLAACMVNGEKPDADRIHGMDLTALYRVSERHLLTGIVGYALEEAGVHDPDFIQAKSKAIRKVLLFSAENAAVLQKLEGAGIWYMPLKGSVLKDCYPKAGMRQMADCDILIDGSRADDVKAVMEGLGFSSKHFGTGTHDCYYKEPVYNFEIHRELFGTAHADNLREYYRDVKDRLLKDENNRYVYHFSQEDFYIYMVAHEYKHFSGSGTGLRSLLDVYVFLKKNSPSLDFGYIEAEVKKLGLDAFERQNRSLAKHLFGNERLTEDEEKMLEYIICSGTYGTVTHHVENSVQKLGGGTKGKVRYLFRRAFLPMESIRSAYPFIYRHKILTPFFHIYRLGKGLLFRQKRIRVELNSLNKNNRQKDKS